MQSFRHKLDYIYHETDEIQAVALCETWLAERIEDADLQIPGFNTIIRRDRLGDAYGGVGLYLRQEIHYERQRELESTSLELLWVMVWTEKGKYLLGVCYRQPSALVGSWDNLCENVERAMNTDIPVILIGDLNCNILEKPNKLETMCQTMGLRILNNEPTHITDHSAACIDIAITSTLTKISSIYTTSPGPSNHCGLIVTIDCPPPKAHSYKKKILQYGKTNWQQVNQDIEDENWPEGDQPLEELTANWMKRYQELIEANTPVKTLKIKPWSKAWYSRAVKQARKRRDKEARRMKKCKLPKIHPVWNKLKRLRDTVKEEVKKAKDKRLAKLIDKVNKDDTGEKTWWKLTRELYNKKLDTTSAPLVIDGKPISDLEIKACKFNEHFANISRIPGIDDPIPEDMIYEEECPQLEDMVFKKEEVAMAMKQMKVDSAPGPDEITNLALSKTADTMSKYLTYLFNCSISEGNMPNHWKEAHVSPIHKGGDVGNINNYRPISLLSCPSKLLERLVCNKMVPFLEENKVFGDQQFGFRKNTSTTDQLLEIYDSMLQALDKQQVKKILFVDVSKALTECGERD